MSKFTVTVLLDRGVFGNCACGGEILYYSNHGVKCSACGRLYAVWHYRSGRKRRFEGILKLDPQSDPIGLKRDSHTEN